MREFYSYDIDEYIAVLHYYYTFPDTKIFLDFVEKVEYYVRVLNCNNTFLYRIIRLKAKFYKKHNIIKEMVETCEKGIEEHRDAICMKMLYEHFKDKNKDMYLKYKGMYLKKTGSKKYEFFLLYKELKYTEEMDNALIEGIRNNEIICFHSFLELYDKNPNKLKWLFMKMNKMTNDVAVENIFILIEKIKVFDPNFIKNLVEWTNDQKLVFQSDNVKCFCLTVIAIVILIKFL